MLQTSGRPGSERRLRSGSVKAAPTDFRIASGSSISETALPRDFAIFAFPSRPRVRAGLAEGAVELPHELAGELQVLDLVVPRRAELRAVGQAVGGHQHRVEEEPRVDVLRVLVGLVLELRHALERPEASLAGQ